MFYPIEGGSVYEVHDNAFGFIFKCQLPPVGYGQNSITDEIEPVDILCRSEIPEEQYFERFKLPADWKERENAEKERRKVNKNYRDPYLENIRAREWHRRLCGVWCWIYNPHKKKSELMYICGLHYFYITFWKFQGKWMDFRINDMEAFYVLKYCEYDPNCLGKNEITKRKLGKTAKLGCWIYERTSRPPYNQHAAFQSKADPDAEEVMKKAIVYPWQKLPEFFRPIYDTMKGDDPSEMRFFHTARRGATTQQEREDEDALESWIEYGASGEGYFDGPELDTYGSDESGKTKRPVSIKERQNIVRYCAEIDGSFHEERDGIIRRRKQYYTTTVEIEKGEEDNYEFQEMTAMSNPLERDDNGRTMTGLYTYFLPAQKGMYFDKYGYPDELRATTYLLNTRKKLQEEGKTRELASFKRKNPMTFKEAFSADGAKVLYDPEILNDQLDNIQWRNDLTEKGDLKWEQNSPFFIYYEENGEQKKRLSKIEWHPNINGKFEKIKGWFPTEPNKVVLNNEQCVPNNNYRYRIGYDTFKYDKTKDDRRSNAAAFVYQIEDEFDRNEFDNFFTLRYCDRPASRKVANLNVLMMAWWCGCQILVERNAGDHYKEHYKDENCLGFLMWLPGESEPGITTDGAGKTIQTICNYTEQYQNEHIKKVYFKTLIRKESGWLGFKVEDTQKFDEPMAAGITLIAVKGKRYVKRREQDQAKVEDLLPYNQAV